MAHRMGISGSVILSDPGRYADLFWEQADHIEIGEFVDEAAFREFLRICGKKGASFGIHSPLYRGQSKNDWMEKVQFEPEYAWDQVESEAKEMAKLGAEYVLVHFPYFKGVVDGDANLMIEEGLQRLSKIQNKYGIQLVCEPKLGLQRSSAGIEYLHHFPKEVWAKYGLKLCIDVGDYFLATGDRILEYIDNWKEHIHVVHLHNVQFMGDKYIWTPVHPSNENMAGYFSLEKVIAFIASQCQEVTFVFEHTPHTNPSKEFVEEGMEWVRGLWNHA